MGNFPHQPQPPVPAGLPEAGGAGGGCGTLPSRDAFVGRVGFLPLGRGCGDSCAHVEPTPPSSSIQRRRGHHRHTRSLSFDFSAAARATIAANDADAAATVVLGTNNALTGKLLTHMNILLL